jgi:O-antigen/teichoic acid export membrane protein
MIKKLIRDSFIYTIPSIFSKGISFFLIPIYTKILSTENYGSLDLFLFYSVIINLIIPLEISQGIARYYSEEHNISQKVKYFTTAFLFNIFCYILFLFSFLFFSEYFSVLFFGKANFYLEFVIGVFFIFFNGLFYFLQNQLKWEFRSKEYSIASIIMTSSTLLFTCLFTIFFEFKLVGILLALAISSIFSFLYCLFVLRTKLRLIFDFDMLKEMLKFSIPLVISGLSIYALNYIGRLMIANLVSISNLGIYALAIKISNIVILVIVGFQSSLSPLIMSNYKLKSTSIKIEKIFNYFFILISIGSILIILFSKFLISLLATSDYLEASTFLIYLVPSVVLSQMYIFAPGISISKKTNYFILVNIFGILINVPLNYVLLRYFGVVGIAISSLITNLIIFIILMTLSQKYYYIPYKWSKIITLSLVLISITIIFNFYFLNYYWLSRFIAFLIIILVILKFNLIDRRDYLKMAVILNKKINFNVWYLRKSS